MTEHHITLEAALRRADTGHSIFAPSGADMWGTCSGSLLPNLFAPENAGFDAAEGTVGHAVGEEWLLRYKALLATFQAKHGRAGLTDESLIDRAEPKDWVGNVETVKNAGIDYEIEITEDMLAYVREYVEWCIALPGDQYIETRVDFSRLTPIDKQGGTADHASCEWQKLTITDLKYGKGIEVYAKDNRQLRLYALGFFYEYDWLYDFQEIVIRICQPRRSHFDVYTYTRAELLEFADFISERAHLAWVVDAPRTPSVKGCLWCKVKQTCPAFVAFVQEFYGGRLTEEGPNVIPVQFQQVLDAPDCPVCEGMGCDACDNSGRADVNPRVKIGADGAIEGQYTVKEMQIAKDMVASGKALTYERPLAELSTSDMEKLLPMRKAVEKWFAAIEEELLKRAHMGVELELWKLSTGRANRAFRNENHAVRFLRSQGIEPEECFNAKVLSPAQAEELLHARLKISKKAAKELLAKEVIQPQGKDSLVPIGDKRLAKPDPGDVFDDL